MLQHRRQRHVEGLGELADRQAVGTLKPRQQRTPGGVGEGGEGDIEKGVLMLYHVVKCRGAPVRCQLFDFLVGS